MLIYANDLEGKNNIFVRSRDFSPAKDRNYKD